MKKLRNSFKIILGIVIICCSLNSQAASLITQKNVFQNDSLKYITSNFISSSEAENILGEKAFIKDSTHTFKNGYLRYLFTYASSSVDSKTKNRKTLFFSLEQFPHQNEAKGIYDNIKTENAKTLTVTDIKNIGEQGFLAKDDAGFPFIMILKEDKLFKFKIRNLTGKASLKKLMELAEKVVNQN